MVDLKQVRHDAGMTQEQLAEASGIKRSTISLIELGTNEPSIPTAKALAKALGFAWHEFYEGGEEDAAHCQGSGQGAAGK